MRHRLRGCAHQHGNLTQFAWLAWLAALSIRLLSRLTGLVNPPGEISILMQLADVDGPWTSPWVLHSLMIHMLLQGTFEA